MPTGRITSSTPDDDAGHAFFATDRPSYRPAAANEGWSRIFAFLEHRLA